MPLFIRALSLSLAKYPVVNSSVDIDFSQLIIHKQQNIGIAISTKHGLIVPVLKNVQAMTLPDLIRKYAELMEKARAEKLTSSDMKEGTVTISNFGALGGGTGLWATPIITHPEVAILAVAKIQKQPIVKNETIVIRDILNLPGVSTIASLMGSWRQHFPTISKPYCSTLPPLFDLEKIY